VYCAVQVNRPSTVVRPWELSPVISTHQPPLAPSFYNSGPTATDSVHAGLSANHTDSGYFSQTPDPAISRQTLVCTQFVRITLICRLIKGVNVAYLGEGDSPSPMATNNGYYGWLYCLMVAHSSTGYILLDLTLVISAFRIRRLWPGAGWPLQSKILHTPHCLTRWNNYITSKHWFCLRAKLHSTTELFRVA